MTGDAVTRDFPGPAIVLLRTHLSFKEVQPALAHVGTYLLSIGFPSTANAIPVSAGLRPYLHLIHPSQ